MNEVTNEGVGSLVDVCAGYCREWSASGRPLVKLAQVADVSYRTIFGINKRTANPTIRTVAKLQRAVSTIRGPGACIPPVPPELLLPNCSCLEAWDARPMPDRLRIDIPLDPRILADHGIAAFVADVENKAEHLAAMAAIDLLTKRQKDSHA